MAFFGMGISANAEKSIVKNGAPEKQSAEMKKFVGKQTVQISPVSQKRL